MARGLVELEYSSSFRKLAMAVDGKLVLILSSKAILVGQCYAFAVHFRTN
jgi:hypothetical protein